MKKQTAFLLDDEQSTLSLNSMTLWSVIKKSLLASFMTHFRKSKSRKEGDLPTFPKRKERKGKKCKESSELNVQLYLIKENFFPSTSIFRFSGIENDQVKYARGRKRARRRQAEGVREGKKREGQESDSVIVPGRMKLVLVLTFLHARTIFFKSYSEESPCTVVKVLRPFRC